MWSKVAYTILEGIVDYEDTTQQTVVQLYMFETVSYWEQEEGPEEYWGTRMNLDVQ